VRNGDVAKFFESVPSIAWSLPNADGWRGGWLVHGSASIAVRTATTVSGRKVREKKSEAIGPSILHGDFSISDPALGATTVARIEFTFCR
jgi:hypothetical protein